MNTAAILQPPPPCLSVCLTFPAPFITIGGAAGSGKSTLGLALSLTLNDVLRTRYTFADGDDFLSPHLRAKLRRGVPLTHYERMRYWIPRLYCHLVRCQSRNTPTVLAFSGLRRVYREIVDVRNTVHFFLDVTPDIARQRIRRRSGHFVGEWIVKSQFETLEVPAPDEDIIVLNANQPLDVLLRCILAVLSDRIKRPALSLYCPENRGVI